MSTLYDRIASSSEGASHLAAARLRYEAIGAIRRAIESAGLSQAELARRLKVRKSAVNQVLKGNGNVTISTLAEYLKAAGFEAEIVVRQPSLTQERRPEYVISLHAGHRRQRPPADYLWPVAAGRGRLLEATR